MDNFDQAVTLIERYVPKFVVKDKARSKIQRVIGWVFTKLGNPNYMTDFYTTIGQTTWLPTEFDRTIGIDTILHEGRHAIQYQRSPIAFLFKYLMPQLIGVVGILWTLFSLASWVLGGSWNIGIANLVVIAFLAPVPALGRYLLELEAFKATLATRFWSGQDISDEWQEQNIVQYLGGAGYWWTWPKTIIRIQLAWWVNELRSGTAKLDTYLLDIKELVGQIKREAL